MSSRYFRTAWLGFRLFSAWENFSILIQDFYKTILKVNFKWEHSDSIWLYCYVTSVRIWTLISGVGSYWILTIFARLIRYGSFPSTNKLITCLRFCIAVLHFCNKFFITIMVIILAGSTGCYIAILVETSIYSISV